MPNLEAIALKEAALEQAALNMAALEQAALEQVSRYLTHFPMHVFAGWKEGSAVVRPVAKGEQLDCWPNKHQTNGDGYVHV